MERKTENITKEFKKDLESLAKATEKGLFHGLTHASKLITYPILGNLSDNLKERIEYKVGKEYFNADNASLTSIITNIGVYPGIIYSFSNDILISGLGGIFALIEILPRITMMMLQGGASASLPGKIVSLPFDYLTNLSEGVKK